MSSVVSNAKVYTDIQGLEQLHYEKNSQIAKKEVAQQFEAIMMQMVLSSMRQANQTFSSDLFGSDAMSMYQDMFDKQLSLAMSKSGVGFADMVEKGMDQAELLQQAALSQPKQVMLEVRTPTVAPALPSSGKVIAANEKPFKDPQDFVKKIWSAAKNAANSLGIAPEVLVAQAALETDWGRKVLVSSKDAATSHNLFNIKAGMEWNNKTVTADALEVNNGLLEKTKSTFRSYDSYRDSFMDYVKLIKENPRYSETLTKVSDPKQYVTALQHAGYATDENYAEKIMQIFTSPSFQHIILAVTGGR